MCRYVGVSTGTLDQKRMSCLLELELQAIVTHPMWILGTNSGLLQEHCVLSHPLCSAWFPTSESRKGPAVPWLVEGSNKGSWQAGHI